MRAMEGRLTKQIHRAQARGKRIAESSGSDEEEKPETDGDEKKKPETKAVATRPASPRHRYHIDSSSVSVKNNGLGGFGTPPRGRPKPRPSRPDWGIAWLPTLLQPLSAVTAASGCDGR